MFVKVDIPFNIFKVLNFHLIYVMSQFIIIAIFRNICPNLYYILP